MMNRRSRIVVILGVSTLVSMQAQAMRQMQETQAVQKSSVKKQEEEMSRLFPQSAASEFVSQALTSPGARNKYFRQLLQDALEKNNISQMQILLQQALKYGFDVNTQDDYGQTLLHEAVFAGNIPVIELLLSVGANPNSKTKQGSPVLHNALWAGINALESIKMLIKAGADINAQNNEGVNLVEKAITAYQIPLVKLLLEMPEIDIDKQTGMALLDRLRKKIPGSEQERAQLQEMIRLLSSHFMTLADISAQNIAKNYALYKDKLHLLPQEAQERVMLNLPQEIKEQMQQEATRRSSQVEQGEENT